jgi:hypothetical protein
VRIKRWISRLTGGTQVRIALAVLLTAPFAGCGGGGGGSSPVTPTPVTQPPGPSQASISVTCRAFTVTTSPVAGFKFRIAFPCTVTESAGLGANANFVRARFTKNGAQVESHDIGASDITRVSGTNHLAARGTLAGTFLFDFNRGDATGGTLEFNFTDDRSNRLSSTFAF